jgi:hypothetical protein
VLVESLPVEEPEPVDEPDPEPIEPEPLVEESVPVVPEPLVPVVPVEPDVESLVDEPEVEVPEDVPPEDVPVEPVVDEPIEPCDVTSMRWTFIVSPDPEKLARIWSPSLMSFSDARLPSFSTSVLESILSG